MADRSLRGMRLGAQSLQSEEGVTFSPRRRSTYQLDDGTTFEVTFAADAEIPILWESPKSGREGHLLGDNGKPVPLDVAEAKILGHAARTSHPRRAGGAAPGAPERAACPPRTAQQDQDRRVASVVPA